MTRYEETDGFYTWYVPACIDDGINYVIIRKYKNPHFKEDKQVLFTIEMPDEKEEH